MKNISDKIVEKLMKMKLAEGVVSTDQEGGNTNHKIVWTPIGKQFLQLLAIYKSYGDLEDQECRFLFEIASREYHVQHLDPPESPKTNDHRF